jgi:hypothetical protein
MKRFQHMVNQIDPMIVKEEKNLKEKGTKGTKHTKREFWKVLYRQEMLAGLGALPTDLFYVAKANQFEFSFIGSLK